MEQYWLVLLLLHLAVWHLKEDVVVPHKKQWMVESNENAIYENQIYCYVLTSVQDMNAYLAGDTLSLLTIHFEDWCFLYESTVLEDKGLRLLRKVNVLLSFILDNRNDVTRLSVTVRLDLWFKLKLSSTDDQLVAL